MLELEQTDEIYQYYSMKNKYAKCIKKQDGFKIQLTTFILLYNW